VPSTRRPSRKRKIFFDSWRSFAKPTTNKRCVLPITVLCLTDVDGLNRFTQQADMLALQEQLENQRHLTEGEKATANELLCTVQRHVSQSPSLFGDSPY
jgi:hypothetical protein